jgi:hypothetical protein
MRDKHQYSISRGIRDLLAKGAPQNPSEADFHFDSLRENPNRATGVGYGQKLCVPIRMPEVSKRQLTSGAWSDGTEVLEGLGVLEWSAVVSAGATVLGPLKQNTQVWHTSDLPTVQWLGENGLITPSDPTLQAGVLSPKRVSCQTIFSRQLVVQSSTQMDRFIERELGRALSQALDYETLYGAGPVAFQSLGLINTPGTNLLPIGATTWNDLVELRRLCLNHDVDRTSFGLITSPDNEKDMLVTEAMPGSGSIWHNWPDPKFFSNEIADDRYFQGSWSYLTIGLFGGSTESPGMDVIVDPYSQAANSQIVVTANLWCDSLVRWPEVFGYSQGNPPPPPPLPLKESNQKGMKAGSK